MSYAVSEVTPVTRLAICPSVCMGCTVSLMMIVFWNFLILICFSFLGSYSFTVSLVSRCIWNFFGRIWSSFTSYLSYAVSEVTPVTRLAICPSVCMGCTVSLMMIIFWNFLKRTCFSFLSSYSFTVSWVSRYIWIFPEDFGPVSLVTWVTQFRKLHQFQGWPSAPVCVWVAQFH